MKNFICVLVFSSFTISGISQNKLMYDYTKGQLIKYESIMYPMLMEKDPSIFTAGDKEKAKKGAAFTADIASGKITPKSTSVISIRVLDVKQDGATTIFKTATEGLPNNISFASYCTKDSAVQIMNEGRTASVKNNDTIAITVYGTSCYPTELKAGNRLRGFSYVAMFADESDTKNLKKMFYREYNYLTTSATVFNEACQNTNPFKPTINMVTLVQPPLVLREEKITLAGKELTAFVLGIETWSKDLRNIKESAYEIELKYLQVPDMSKKYLKAPSHEAGGKRVWKKGGSAAFMDTNEYDFTIAYREEWYVAGLGVVKTAFYDTNGALFSISQLKSIE